MTNYQTRRRVGAEASSIFEKLEDRRLMSAVALATPPVASPHATPATQLSAVSATGTGLSGEYYSDSNFQSAYLLRTDATVKLTPNAKKDPSAVQAQSIRWTGKLAPSFTEQYSFSVVANGGIQLYVDGQLIINQSQAKGGNYLSQKISLTAGKQYSIEIDYTRATAAGAKVQLNWASHHQKLGAVPQKALFPDATASLQAVNSGLIGQYYIGKDFKTPIMQRVDSTINFSFAANSPTFLIPKGSPFSVRWTGQITPTYSETYTFTTVTDDGVKLYVNDQLIIGDFVDHSAKSDSAQITLQAGVPVDIRMDYYENHGVATAKLLWTSASQKQEIVPASAFTSTPPASAGRLIATAIDDDSVHLDWTGSVSATGYNVEQSIDGGMTYQIIQTADANATECDVVGLSPNTNYMFKVVPWGSQDTSIVSNPISTTTAPPTPGGLTATPASPTSMNMTWQNVPGDAGYAIYEASPTDPTHFTQIATVPTDVTNYTVNGLSPANDYLFAISSINSQGTQSDMSDPVTGTTLTNAPGSIGSGDTDPNSVVLNWADVPGENGFSIERAPTGSGNWQQIATTTKGVTTYTDTMVLPGTGYDYRVRSRDDGGASDPSSTLSVVTAVSSPTGVAASAITTMGTMLNWNDVAGETGFEILESTDGGQTFSQVGITAAGVTTYTVAGLNSGVNYQFAVEALNTAGASSVPSTIASVITLPSAPSNLAASALTATGATINWSDVTGETGFTLQRSSDGITGWSTVVTLPVGTLSYTDTTLSPGNTYFYRISALNSTGSSPFAPIVSALTIPSSPSAALTGLSTTQSQVSWNAVSGAAQYTIQRSLDGSSSWTTVSTVSGSATSATVANLAASTMYYYRVQASNASGASGQSPTVSQVSAPTAANQVHSVVYGTTASGNIFSVNLQAGTSNWIGQLPVTPHSAVRDPISGVLYFYKQGTSDIYVWNPATGNTSLVDTSFIPTPTASGAYLPDGTSFIVGTNSVLYQGHSQSASITPIGSLTIAGQPFTDQPTSMTFSPAGGLYMTVGANIFTVNTTTAAVTPLATTAIGNILMVFGPEGVPYVTTANGNLYSLNPATLVYTLLGNDNLPAFTSLAADAVFTHLGITAAASPTTFHKGGTGAYNIAVTNTAGDATSQPITVTTTLQSGLTFNSVSGTGWAATVSGQAVTMTYTGSVAANGTVPACTMNIAIASSANSVITTTFTVIGSDFDNNPVPATTAVVTPAT